MEQVATHVLHSESFAGLLVPLAVMTLDLGTGEQRRVSPFEFDKTAALIDDAHEAARDQLRSVTIVGPGLYGDPCGRYVVSGHGPLSRSSSIQFPGRTLHAERRRRELVIFDEGRPRQDRMLRVGRECR